MFYREFYRIIVYTIAACCIKNAFCSIVLPSPFLLVCQAYRLADSPRDYHDPDSAVLNPLTT
jgi:hypothetical protein